MSEPTRYDAADLRCKKCQKNVDFFGVLRSHDEGRFVMWEDYVALQAENERLRSVAQDNKAETEATCLQNERLRKAGYAMAIKINVHGINDKFTDSQKLIDDWCAAAKGVQP